MVAVKGSQDYRGRQSEFKTNDSDFPCDFLVFLKCYLLVQKCDRNKVHTKSG